MLFSSISRPGVVNRAEMGTEAAYVNSYNVPVLLFAHLLFLRLFTPLFPSAQSTVERFIPGPVYCRLAIVGKAWLLRPAPDKSLSSSRVSAGVAPYLHPLLYLYVLSLAAPLARKPTTLDPSPASHPLQPHGVDVVS